MKRTDNPVLPYHFPANGRIEQHTCQGSPRRGDAVLLLEGDGPRRAAGGASIRATKKALMNTSVIPGGLTFSFIKNVTGSPLKHLKPLLSVHTFHIN